MIKVCHLTSVHSRYDGRILLKECVSLSKAGYNMYLVVNDRNEDEDYSGVKICSTRFVPHNRISRMITSQKAVLKKAREIDADIYHFHDPELLNVGLILKRQGKRVVFDSHENYPMQIEYKPYLPHWLGKIVSKLYYLYESYVVKRLDAVVFPCTFSGKNPFLGRARKTFFVGNPPLLEELYDKYSKFQKDSFKICYIGSLQYVRGIEQIIKAADKAGVTLILAGNFPDLKFKAELEQMKEFKNVDFRGMCSRQQVLEILEESSVGICTILSIGQHNKEDILSTKVYEYMAMKLPVIITDYPYAAEVLRSYKFGIAVDAFNVDQISKAILYLKEHPTEAEKMGTAGRKAVQERYNWNIEEKTLCSLYESIT